MEMNKNDLNGPSTLDAAVYVLAEELMNCSPELRPEEIQGMAFILDSTLTITGFNPEAEQTLGYGHDELVDKPIARILSEESAGELAMLQPALAQPATYCSTSEIIFSTRRGTAVPCYCYISGAGIENGLLLIAIKFAHHEKTTQARIRQAIYRINQLIKQRNNHRIRATSPDDERVRKTVQDTRNQITQSVTVSDLARDAMMSETKFKKIFKRLYGLSVQQFITNALVNRALLLLSDPNVPVKRVAQTLGYSLQGFERMFKRATGQTPGTYRNNDG